MKRLAMLWLPCVMMAAPAVAQTPRPMDYADIFRVANIQNAELSPDGAWVVYEVSKLQFPDWQRRTDLFVASADGRTTRQLTYTEGEDESGAAWQPKGTLIGFTSSREGKKRQLFLIRPDGGEARKITSADDGIGAWAWSEDGTRLAYLAGPEGKRQLWTLAGDGSGKAEQLTKHATAVDAFTWSVDGRTIYFTAADEPDSTRRRRMKEKFDVRVMNEPAAPVHLWAFDLTGRTEKRLTQGDFRIGGGFGGGGIELSRDGRWAAFRGRATDRYADDRASELYLVNLATGATERLTNNYVGEGQPSFSPDSRLIAFSADRDFKYGNLSRVYVRPVAGGDWRELGKGDSHDFGMSFWSGDGKTIFFNGDEGGNGHDILFVTADRNGGPQQDLVTHQLGLLSDALLRARGDRIAKESLVTLATTRNGEALPAVLQNTVIAGRKQELASLEAEYRKLAQTFKPEYPRMQQLAEKIAETRQQVRVEVDRVVTALHMDYQAATPELIADAIVQVQGRAIDYRPVETDGASRAAALIAGLL